MIGVLLDMEAYMGMSLIEVLREMIFLLQRQNITR